MGSNVIDPRVNLMYPFEEKDQLTNINSMKQFHDQPLPFRLPFSGFQYHYIWVSAISSIACAICNLQLFLDP